MAKQEEKNWWDEFAYMTPQEQQWVMAEHGLPYTPPTEFTYESEEDPYGEFAIPQIALMPEFTSKGALDPRDLTQTNKAIDTTKDYAGSLVDNVLTMLSGGGAYDTSAFTPTMEYGKEVTQPGRQRLDDLAARGGWEGYIARKIRDDNMTVSQAMAALEADLASVPADDPDQDPAVKALRASLPKMRQDTGPGATAARIAGDDGEKGFWDTYDYDKVFNVATELQDAVYQDPTPGWTDPDTGRMYDAPPETIKTPQMEWYDKYGLPYPTASYTDPEYLERELNREEGTTPLQREAELAGYLPAYDEVVGQRQQAEAAQRGQGDLERQMAEAWAAVQQPEPLATRPNTFMNMGSAGVEYGRENVPSPNAPGARTIRNTAEQATIPTTTLIPGRQLANPTPGTNPRTGIGAGNTWAYTNDQGQMFNQNPNAPAGVPTVRTLADGTMNVLGGGVTPQPGMGQGFGVLAPGQMFKDPLFSAFTAPKGSETRPMKGSDVSGKARAARRDEAERKAGEARTRQSEMEARDPRLNDLEAFTRLFWAAQRGRTPLGDAKSSRLAGMQRLGL